MTEDGDGRTETPLELTRRQLLYLVLGILSVVVGVPFARWLHRRDGYGTDGYGDGGYGL